MRRKGCSREQRRWSDWGSPGECNTSQHRNNTVVVHFNPLVFPSDVNDVLLYVDFPRTRSTIDKFINIDPTPISDSTQSDQTVRKVCENDDPFELAGPTAVPNPAPTLP
ncbi:hypothetical protein HRR77_001392 [Exophiala dermatitidis]|nr:hypothetical protein HRR77_001392 [Exophiala dermatitidis]KAJ4572220.1 hypothetical protein HRR79_003427 [Exophiala dermatitidis]KAJ4619045.1 hypothetical protein HRR85_002042 [Exophiala dermatitidis]